MNNFGERSQLPRFEDVELMTLAVSFDTKENAQTSAREVSMLLRDGWRYTQTMATPASVHGVALFHRIIDGQPKGETEHGKR